MSKRLSITIDGHRVPYSVRVSQRAKRARLTINPVDGLVVVLPAGYERSRVPAILKAHAPWVIKHIDRIAAPAAPVIRDGATVLFRGEHTPVKI